MQATSLTTLSMICTINEDVITHQTHAGALGMVEQYHFCNPHVVLLRPQVKGLLLHTGSEEREVLGVWSIPVAILPSCQYIKILHHTCINMNIVG